MPKGHSVSGEIRLCFDRFHSVVNFLASGQQLPKRLYDHELKGEYAGARECHIESDWLLIYYKDELSRELHLLRTGTHAKLFGD